MIYTPFQKHGNFCRAWQSQGIRLDRRESLAHVYALEQQVKSSVYFLCIDVLFRDAVVVHPDYSSRRSGSDEENRRRSRTSRDYGTSTPQNYTNGAVPSNGGAEASYVAMLTAPAVAMVPLHNAAARQEVNYSCCLSCHCGRINTIPMLITGQRDDPSHSIWRRSCTVSMCCRPSSFEQRQAFLFNAEATISWCA